MSPTSTSREAIDETHATPADPKPQSFPLPAGDEGQGEGFNTPSTQRIAADPKSPSSGRSTPNPQPSPKPEIPYFQGPYPLPPEVIAENRRYAEKLRTGKIILDFSGDGVREIIVDDENEKETPTPKPNLVGDDVRSPSPSNSHNAAAKQ